MAGDTQQLIKKRSQGVGYQNIYPKTYIELVSDRMTNQLLSDILARFNFLYLVYDEDASNTRLQVEPQYRRKGLWIAYVRTDGTLITEYSISDNIDDETWSSDTNWQSSTTAQIDIKSLEPEDLTLELEKITFANRAYDPSTYSGKGYTILRKNIQTVPSVGTVNLLTQGMISDPNTVYEIRYDFNLNGATINIPEGSVLNFVGGSLNNGEVIFNNTQINEGRFININPSGTIYNAVAYAKWFTSDDDTKAIAWLFTIAATGVLVELENKTYNINTTNPNGYSTALVNIENCNSFNVNGNGAVLYDTIEYDVLVDKLYAFIRFTNCSNVSITNITYKWAYKAEIVDKVKGIIFIRTIGECSNFNLDFEVINVGRGLYSGVFGNTNIGRGFCDSTVKVRATKVGYPIAIEIGDNNNFYSNYEEVHRGNYYCGLSNSKVYVIGKNPVGTNCHVLLSDGATTTDYLHCKNVDIIVEDTGSTTSNIFGVLVQTYSPTVAPHLANRVTSYNISFNAKVHFPKNTTATVEPIVWVGESELIDNVNFSMDTTILSSNENNRFMRLNHDSFRSIAKFTGYIANVTNTFVGALEENEHIEFYDLKGDELTVWFEGTDSGRQGTISFVECYNTAFAVNKSGNVYPTIYKYNSNLRYGTNAIVNVVNTEPPAVLDGTTITTTSNSVIIKSKDRNPYITFSGIILGNLQSIDVILIPEVDGTLLIASNIGLMGGIRQNMRLKANKYYNFKLIRVEEKYCLFAPAYDTDASNRGTTANRPQSGDIYSGFSYWDETIGEPIWWGGSQWIDSSGNPADALKTGTTEQRPTGVQIGFIYKDTTLDQLVVWDGVEWKPFYSGVPQSDSEFIVNV